MPENNPTDFPQWSTFERERIRLTPREKLLLGDTFARSTVLPAENLLIRGVFHVELL